jgi:hypothetical protein
LSGSKILFQAQHMPELDRLASAALGSESRQRIFQRMSDYPAPALLPQSFEPFELSIGRADQIQFRLTTLIALAGAVEQAQESVRDHLKAQTARYFLLL